MRTLRDEPVIHAIGCRVCQRVLLGVDETLRDDPDSLGQLDHDRLHPPRPHHGGVGLVRLQPDPQPGAVSWGEDGAHRVREMPEPVVPEPQHLEPPVAQDPLPNRVAECTVQRRVRMVQVVEEERHLDGVGERM